MIIYENWEERDYKVEFALLFVYDDTWILVDSSLLLLIDVWIHLGNIKIGISVPWKH